MKSSDAKVRKALKDECSICDIALVKVIHTRHTENGEAVNAICQDLEDFQRQLGDVVYSKNALKLRFYRNHPGFNQRPDKKEKKEKTEPNKEDRFGTLMDSLNVINGVVQGMDFEPSHIESLKQILGLIFRNLEGKE